ncbi:hypothetical protein SM0020_01080 [Sinorhizobium meliloti CCNWSX0020]|uniref:Uncharacterized protein n=1 Tax=Sinorhizobium meliloti CCNWSX0020 TaxID=1107881 RepID=H0FSV1_RHIML|nr:hypothetical protein SM0020_01080 [Sinorhizobium meliloti CCNWSX0020]
MSMTTDASRLFSACAWQNWALSEPSLARSIHGGKMRPHANQ